MKYVVIESVFGPFPDDAQWSDEMLASLMESIADLTNTAVLPHMAAGDCSGRIIDESELLDG